MARTRAKRIGVLTSTNRKATGLYKTGAWPQAAYEIEAIGLSPFQGQ